MQYKCSGASFDEQKTAQILLIRTECVDIKWIQWKWNENRICSGQQTLYNEHLQNICNTQREHLPFSDLWVHCEFADLYWSWLGGSTSGWNSGWGCCTSIQVCSLVYSTVVSLGTRLKWQQLPRGSLFHDRNFKNVGINSQFLWSFNRKFTTPTYIPLPSTSLMVKPMVNEMRKYSFHPTNWFC